MKKTKIFSIVFAVGLLSLIVSGCGNPSGGNPSGSGSGSGSSGSGTSVEKETHTAKSTDLIKFKMNVTDAKFLATKWADETNERAARAAYARKAAREGDDAAEETSPLDSLVAVVEKDGELKEETIMEVPVEELKLAEWCIPQPVREIYQCPYDSAEKKAKGIYTIFACYIDWWKYEDDTPAPGISMIMYAKPDGTTVDVLNKEGKVNYFLTTWQKENEGEDYIQFDESGNLFALAKDDSTNEYLIFRYNPLSDDLDEYKLTNIKGQVYIRNFKVTRDGKWIFLNVMVDDVKNNVYAIKVNSTDDPITMYEYTSSEKPKEPTWAVSSIGINPLTNLVYWYVDDYNDLGKPASGLYIAEKTTSGYSAANVKRYHTIEWWQIVDAAKRYIAKDKPIGTVIPADSTTAEYDKLLAFLKGECCYEGDIEFNLSVFEDMTDEACKGWDGSEYTKDFSKLAKKDADGKYLTDIAALKYLFETKLSDVDDYANEHKDEDWTQNNLFESLLQSFFYECWNERENTTEDGKKVTVGAGLYKDSNYPRLADQDDVAFPLDFVMFQKGTTKSAYMTDESEPFIMSTFGAKTNGIILANDEGTWVLSDVWDMVTENNDHSIAYQLTDKRGIFTCTQPDKLKTLEFRPKYDKETADRDPTDPWYQKPFAANSKGIAALANDQKTVFYHSNGVTKDLIANLTGTDATVCKTFNMIYSFSLQEDKLIYNAIKKNGGYLMVSVDLKTNEATKLPIEKQVESMLGL